MDREALRTSLLVRQSVFVTFQQWRWSHCNEACWLRDWFPLQSAVIDWRTPRGFISSRKRCVIKKKKKKLPLLLPPRHGDRLLQLLTLSTHSFFFFFFLLFYKTVHVTCTLGLIVHSHTWSTNPLLPVTHAHIQWRKLRCMYGHTYIHAVHTQYVCRCRNP